MADTRDGASVRPHIRPFLTGLALTLIGAGFIVLFPSLFALVLLTTGVGTSYVAGKRLREAIRD